MNSRPVVLWSPLVRTRARPVGAASAGAGDVAGGSVGAVVTAMIGSGHYLDARSHPRTRAPTHTAHSHAPPEELIHGHGAEEQGDVGDRPAEQPDGGVVR